MTFREDSECPFMLYILITVTFNKYSFSCTSMTLHFCMGASCMFKMMNSRYVSQVI